MAVTLRDVAEATGVSMSTVSRVISDSPRISMETKMKVRKAMNELGYHPNFIARSLVNQSTNVMGIVFPSSGNSAFQNPFFTEVLRAISEGAHEHKYGIQLTTGKNETEILNDVINMVQGRRVDGILMLYSRIDDPIMAYLLAQKFPFVVIGQPSIASSKITWIDNDNVAAAKEATQTFLNHGHKQVAFIGAKDSFTMTIARISGYKEALQEAGIPIRQEYIIQNEIQSKDENHVIKKLMASIPPPTAILVEDDFLAVKVLQALHEQGLKVPQNVALMGFNNTILSELSSPSLSSVDIHIFDLGLEAVKQLVAQIVNKNEPIKRIVIPHKIVIHGSC